MELTLSQVFEVEKFNRDIDSCNDINEVKAIAKKLLHMSHLQQAQSRWLIHNSNPRLTDFNDFIEQAQAA
jgi:hypothetical protein